MPEREGLVVLLAFGTTVACISPLPDGAAGVRWALLSVGVPLICWRVASSWSPCRTSWLVLAFAGASLFWSPDPLTGLELWWHFALLAALVGLAPGDMPPVYWAIGAGLAVNSAVVALQMAGFHPVASLDGMTGTGLFFNKNQQNCLLVLAVIGLISLDNWWARGLAAVAALPLAVAPVTRTPLLALAAVALVAVCRRYRLLIPAAAVLALGLLFALAAQPARLVHNSMRLATWTDAAANLTFLGHGLGSFRWAYPEMEHAHNDLLQLAFELGAPGAVCYIVALCYLLWLGPLTERLILVAFAIEGAFDFPLYQPATGFLAALAAGRILRARAVLRRAAAGLECPGGGGEAQPRAA